MCENCDKIRLECWQEIRDLLNYKRPNKGPLSTKLHEALEEMLAEQGCAEHIETRMDAIRAEMIAQRCAVIAMHSPGSEYHKDFPSSIFKDWSVESLKAEGPVGLLRLMMDSAHVEILDLRGLMGEDDD